MLAEAVFKIRQNPVPYMQQEHALCYPSFLAIADSLAALVQDNPDRGQQQFYSELAAMCVAAVCWLGGPVLQAEALMPQPELLFLQCINMALLQITCQIRADAFALSPTDATYRSFMTLHYHVYRLGAICELTQSDSWEQVSALSEGDISTQVATWQWGTLADDPMLSNSLAFLHHEAVQAMQLPCAGSKEHSGYENLTHSMLTVHHAVLLLTVARDELDSQAATLFSELGSVVE